MGHLEFSNKNFRYPRKNFQTLGLFFFLTSNYFSNSTFIEKCTLASLLLILFEYTTKGIKF